MVSTTAGTLEAGIAADLNFAEMCRTLSRNVGGRILEVDGLLLWAGVHPSPAIVNGLIRTGTPTTPSAPAALELAATWFAELGHGYGLHVRAGRDDDLEALAAERGFQRLIDLPVMVHDGPPPDAAVPEGYTLRAVEDASDVADLVEAVAGPFELLEEVASAFSRPASVLSPFVGAVVARGPDGRPVAGAWTAVSHAVAGIGFVGTAEAARGRGLGTAVTAAAMGLGFDMGARRAALQASPMGFPVYARMGFRTVGHYRLLVDPASAKAMAAAH